MQDMAARGAGSEATGSPCCCQPGLWCRRFISERGVRPDGVVVFAPAFGQHAQFLDRVEDLAVEELIAHLRVEALAVAVLPRRAGFDVHRLCSCIRQPFAQVMGYELGPVIRAKMLRHTLDHHHVGQGLDHLRTRPAPFHAHHESFARVLVDQVQHPYCSSIVCAGADEVITPHMIAMRRPEPHARSIVEPQPATRLLLLRYLQPLATPDPLDSILAHLPACRNQQRRNAPIAITAILAGQNNDGLRESIFVFAPCRSITLRAAWLLYHPTRPALAHPVLLMSMIHRTAPSLGA